MISSYYAAQGAPTTVARIAAALAVDVAADGDDHGTAQARAIAGGMQQHSVGDIYPLAVVGIGNGGSTHYEVHNLQTGKKMCADVGGVVSIRRWYHAQYACEAASGEVNTYYPTVWR